MFSFEEWATQYICCHFPGFSHRVVRQGEMRFIRRIPIEGRPNSAIQEFIVCIEHPIVAAMKKSSKEQQGEIGQRVSTIVERRFAGVAENISVDEDSAPFLVTAAMIGLGP
jgi:hypothetical protein